MDKITVAQLEMEGDWLTIYGKQAGVSWSFWTEGTSMGMDENDDEEWRSWTTEPVAGPELSPARRLAALLPHKNPSRVPGMVSGSL